MMTHPMDYAHDLQPRKIDQKKMSKYQLQYSDYHVWCCYLAFWVNQQPDKIDKKKCRKLN